MKNLKKLDRDQLKSISGEGLLDPVGQLIGGVFGAIGGIAAGLGGVVNGTVTGVLGVVGNGLCQVQCAVGHVVKITVVSCDANTCN